MIPNYAPRKAPIPRYRENDAALRDALIAVGQPPTRILTSAHGVVCK